MAKNNIGLHFEGWEDYMAKLDELGGNDTMKRGAEAGLIEAKKVVTPKIKKLIKNLPADAKYSTGATEESLDDELKVHWDAYTGYVNIGFDLGESGDTSIFLMYGTPKSSPVPGLKNAIYGKKTQEQIAEVEMEALNKVIDRIMSR